MISDVLMTGNINYIVTAQDLFYGRASVLLISGEICGRVLTVPPGVNNCDAHPFEMPYEFLLAAALTIFYAKKVGLPYTLFTIIGLAASLSRAQGIARYLIVVFPLFVAAAFFLKNRSLYHLVLYINILFLVLFTIMFSHWYWVA